MKKILWMVGGLCAAAIGILVLSPRLTRSVRVLDQRSEADWQDQPMFAD